MFKVSGLKLMKKVAVAACSGREKDKKVAVAVCRL